MGIDKTLIIRPHVVSGPRLGPNNRFLQFAKIKYICHHGHRIIYGCKPSQYAERTLFIIENISMGHLREHAPVVQNVSETLVHAL